MFTTRRHRHDRQLALTIGLVLLVATYAVFSIRAVLDPVAPGELFSLKRLLATTAGSGLFMLAVAKAATMTTTRWSERLTALLWVTAIGSIAIFAFRIGYDVLVDNRPEAVIARNARWVLAWLGYFGSAIGGYFAITFVKQAMRREPAAPAFDRADIAAVMAAEVAEWPPAERRALIARLSRIRDYDEADPLVGCLDAPPRG